MLRMLAKQLCLLYNYYMSLKVCSKCRQSRVFPDDFFKDRTSKSGYSGRCKKCDQAIKRNPEAIKRGQNNFRTIHGTAYWKKYQDKFPYDPEKASAYRMQRIQQEREYRRAYLQKRRDNDPGYREWKAKKDKEYRQTSLGKLRLLRGRIKRHSYKDGGKITPEQWERTLEAFHHACAYCGSIDNLNHDHFIPLKKVGQTSFGNLIPACPHCNSSKGDRMPDKWCTPDQLSCVMGILKKLLDASAPVRTYQGLCP